MPWAYAGSLFSSFAFHVEDASLFSCNYHHQGQPKVWYGIPASHKEEFERVMREEKRELLLAQPSLLHDINTMISPKLLNAHGIPITRAVQKPNDLVVTFPAAYHGGFNAGFNLAEAVNVAPPSWLPFGLKAEAQYRQERRESPISVDELVACAVSQDVVPKTGASELMRQLARLSAELKADVELLNATGQRVVCRMADCAASSNLRCSVCSAAVHMRFLGPEAKGHSGDLARVFCVQCGAQRGDPDAQVVWFRHGEADFQKWKAKLQPVVDGRMPPRHGCTRSTGPRGP